MKRIATAFFLTLLAVGPAMALTAQQEKMKECNAEASKKNLKGEERKTFMSSCLSSEAKEAKQLTPQQEKMKTCNAEASKQNLKGDQRKKFMSTCLSGK